MFNVLSLILLTVTIAPAQPNRDEQDSEIVVAPVAAESSAGMATLTAVTSSKSRIKTIRSVSGTGHLSSKPATVPKSATRSAELLLMPSSGSDTPASPLAPARP